MKRRDLTPYTLRAIEVTGGVAEFKDRRAPTWDGRSFHFARLRHEHHVLHEVAHWIAAPPSWRAYPNYGLGSDPDGGPPTEPFFGPALRDSTSTGEVDAVFESIGISRTLLRALDFDTRATVLGTCIEKVLSLEEELASFLTVILTHRAGLGWRSVLRVAKFGALLAHGECGIAKMWSLAAELARRGVDLQDPLAPFVRRRPAAVGASVALQEGA